MLAAGVLATDRLAAVAAERTTWVRQQWKVFGVTYTEITTTVGYGYPGSRVTGVNRCYGTFVNYVPMRSIDKNSWSSTSGGTATCKTVWQLGRPLQPTVTGIQGLKVNGRGTILQKWLV